MGLSFSHLSLPLVRVLRKKTSVHGGNVKLASLLNSLRLWRNGVKKNLPDLTLKNGENAVDRSPRTLKNWESENPNLQVEISSTYEKTEAINLWIPCNGAIAGAPPPSSPTPADEKYAAATKLQKFYKSYRTRRNLADCAVVVEELWWKALDFASLSKSSISFFNEEKPETAVSRWARARTRAAKVGKGLSKDEKAQKLALRHWLEAIDPRHRYGHNLHLYYEIWFNSESTEPFFYWLDIGGGKEVNLEKCSRSKLQQQCIHYLGPKERRAYEVIVKGGKLVYEQTLIPVNSVGGSKSIFVLSTSRKLYVGQKKKGRFQHSSFLSGGATTSAGRLVAINGVLQAIWPYSGHYHPTEENFKEFISFLEEKEVDLTSVKKCSIDDDEFPSFIKRESTVEETGGPAVSAELDESTGEEAQSSDDSQTVGPTFGKGGPISCQWSTGVGPRIGCVRDYPVDLQFMALEQVNLSPRPGSTQGGIKGPIPSPRPSPRMRLSPRFSHMGIPSPRVSLSLPKSKERVDQTGIPSPRVSLSRHKSRDRVEHMGNPSPRVSLAVAKSNDGVEHMGIPSTRASLSLPKSKDRVRQMGIFSPRVSLSLPKSEDKVEQMGIPTRRVSLSLPKSKDRVKRIAIPSPIVSLSSQVKGESQADKHPRPRFLSLAKSKESEADGHLQP